MEERTIKPSRLYVSEHDQWRIVEYGIVEDLWPHLVARQTYSNQSEGYFHLVTEIGSGSEEEVLNYLSLQMGHVWVELHPLGKDKFEYISWAEGYQYGYLEAVVKYVLTSKERLSANEMRVALALGKNLAKLKRSYFDISLIRLAREAGVPKYVLNELLDKERLPCFYIERENGVCRVFFLCTTA